MERLPQTAFYQEMSVQLLLHVARFRNCQHGFPNSQGFADQLIAGRGNQASAIQQVLQELAQDLQTAKEQSQAKKDADANAMRSWDHNV